MCSYPTLLDDSSCSIHRWQAWAMRAASQKGLHFRATLELLLSIRVGLNVSDA